MHKLHVTTVTYMLVNGLIHNLALGCLPFGLVALCTFKIFCRMLGAQEQHYLMNPLCLDYGNTRKSVAKQCVDVRTQKHT